MHLLILRRRKVPQVIQQLPEQNSLGYRDPLHRGMRVNWRRVLNLAVAAILLTSASLKAHELASGPLPPGDIFQNRWLILAVVQWEFVLAAWLLSKVAKRAVWLALTATFTAFLSITLFRAISGESSCGCFGKVQVNPWITLCLDATILTLLIVLHPRWVSAVREFWHVKRVLAAGLGAVIAGSIVAIGCVRNDVPAGVPESADAGQQTLVVLNPSEWVGKEFPLGSYVTLDQPLMQGAWIAVLYHHDCEHCRLLLKNLGEQVRQHPPGPADPPMAAIEMPPFVKDGGVPPMAAAVAVLHQGRLSATRDWFGDTPIIVALRDGRVLFAKQQAGFAAIDQAKEALRAADRQSGPVDTELGTERLFRLCSVTAENDDSWFDHLKFGPDVPVVRVKGNQGEFGFGEVRSESVHAVIFELKNGGTAPLNVTNVRSECSCLRFKPNTLVVPPGGTARVLVGYKAPGILGPYHGRVLVTVEGAAPILLTLRATVQPKPAGVFVCNLE
jgi:hypothetical protein